MHFYGLDDRQVLTMPVRRFWLLNRSVDRIKAEESIQLLKVMAAAQSGETFAQVNDDFRQQMGTVVEFDKAKVAMTAALDKAGLAVLKSMKSVGTVIKNG